MQTCTKHDVLFADSGECWCCKLEKEGKTPERVEEEETHEDKKKRGK